MYLRNRNRYTFQYLGLDGKREIRFGLFVYSITIDNQNGGKEMRSHGYPS